jgi:transposase
MVESLEERRKLRQEHLERKGPPPGPPCPLCKSASYVIARGSERTQFKCVRHGHGFVHNNSDVEEEPNEIPDPD